MKRSKEKIFFIKSGNKSIEGNLWNQIQDIILNNIKSIKLEGIEKEDNEKEDKNFKLIEHKDGNNFDGIIKYLQNKYGKDMHNKGSITLASSSSMSGYKPEKAINSKMNEKEHILSKDLRESYMSKIKFKWLLAGLNISSLSSNSNLILTVQLDHMNGS